MRSSSAYAKSTLIPALLFIAVTGMFLLWLTLMQRSAADSAFSQPGAESFAITKSEPFAIAEPDAYL